MTRIGITGDFNWIFRLGSSLVNIPGLLLGYQSGSTQCKLDLIAPDTYDIRNRGLTIRSSANPSNAKARPVISSKPTGSNIQ
jgi:hypothetical protein